MKLGKVLELETPPETLAPGLGEVEVRGLDYDSRRIEPGYLFFAFAGDNFDGRDFARQAMERGAVAVVSELEAPAGFEGPWIRVPHGREAMGLAARNFYAEAAARIAVTGVTGTNGKTTTAYLADAIFRAAGNTTALIGTVGYQLAGRELPAVNTTPESVDLYRLFQQLADLGGTQATMEVSSHALALGRVHGLEFHTAVFTNLTRDHLDFHETMERYFTSKRLLFTGRKARPPQHAVINLDDSWAEKIETDPATEVLWYGLGEKAGLRATGIRSDFSGIRFRLHWEGATAEVSSPMLGQFNVHNILAAIGAGLAHGIGLETILVAVEGCRAVPGRFEKIEVGQPFAVVVDYAHTDDALRNVIAAARALKPRRVLTVFGCGGARDRSKRPLMGEAVGGASDFVVVTTDNPRSEDPLAIINDTLVGLRRYDVPHKVELNREQAIRIALNEAREGDLVLIAGKGHETYQVLKTGPVPFDDREVSRRVLGELGYGGAA